MGTKSSIKWSILIPTLPARRELLIRLLGVLEPQLDGYDDIELLILEDNRKREYGPKLQAMIDIAQGEYVNFIDDDDLISDDYVELIYPSLDGVDCVGFVGQISIDSGPWENVFYSMKNTVWRNEPDGYYRSPQHLTPIRREIVAQIPWVGHRGADKVWSDKLANGGLIKTENFIDKPVYYYYAETEKNRDGVWI